MFYIVAIKKDLYYKIYNYSMVIRKKNLYYK